MAGRLIANIDAVASASGAACVHLRPESALLPTTSWAPDPAQLGSTVPVARCPALARSTIAAPHRPSPSLE